MTLNRLICPLSEHAMPDWIRGAAVGDIVGEDFSAPAEDALYRDDRRTTGVCFLSA